MAEERAAISGPAEERACLGAERHESLERRALPSLFLSPNRSRARKRSAADPSLEEATTRAATACFGRTAPPAPSSSGTITTTRKMTTMPRRHRKVPRRGARATKAPLRAGGRATLRGLRIDRSRVRTTMITPECGGKPPSPYVPEERGGGD